MQDLLELRSEPRAAARRERRTQSAGGYARAAAVYTAYCAVLVAFARALVLQL